MTIALYMDEHVRRAVTLGLRLRGVDVLTVQEDNRIATPDPILLYRAAQLGRVIFSKDQDFLIEAHRRQIERIEFSGVIDASQFSSVGDCIRDLEILAKVSDPKDLVNSVQYLPL